MLPGQLLAFPYAKVSRGNWGKRPTGSQNFGERLDPGISVFCERPGAWDSVYNSCHAKGTKEEKKTRRTEAGEEARVCWDDTSHLLCLKFSMCRPFSPKESCVRDSSILQIRKLRVREVRCLNQVHHPVKTAHFQVGFVSKDRSPESFL